MQRLKCGAASHARVINPITFVLFELLKPDTLTIDAQPDKIRVVIFLIERHII